MYAKMNVHPSDEIGIDSASYFLSYLKLKTLILLEEIFIVQVKIHKKIFDEIQIRVEYSQFLPYGWI